MLQQILRDMYYDPDLLAGLDEQEKQLLFCKMREEQVRRWKMWNEKLGDEVKPINNNNSKKKKKNVSFLQGEDGEPWVWVMGEHKDDKTIEEILKEEAIEKARQIAEKEAEELRKHLSEYMELTPKIEEIQEKSINYQDDMDIYCSVDELREKINNKPMKKLNNYSLDHYNNKYNSMDTRDVLQEISLNTQKVAHRVALWEKRLTEERTCEIFRKIQKKHEEVAKEAEEAAQKQEQLWREQERKAKQAEQQIREIARKAREEHRLTSTLEIDTNYSTIKTGTPASRNAVLVWYQNVEKPKLTGLDESNNYEPWFHGLITRSEAEELLTDQPSGTFLVRLSEKIWGYAISYKAKDKCKHYLVYAGQNYQFMGNNQLKHDSLRDLIEYHKQNPLTGGEKLIEPCPREKSLQLGDGI